VSFASDTFLDVIGVIVHEVLGEPVDGLVGQMHTEVGLVGIGGFFLLGGAETEKPVFVQEHPQRVDGGDEHVESDVELQPVDQEWFHYLLLADPLLLLCAVDFAPVFD